ncbi:MAG: hypothetical protein IT454_02605 [Planctomycetes bacterium]|nr:hypothetical protein [Planctomycetota bacterium]
MTLESQFEVVWTPAPVVDAEAELPGRYELVRDIGDGVLGPRFGVRDAQDGGRMVQLEVVPARFTANAEAAAELESALRAARRVVSAHVARVRDAGQLSDGRWFVVSEWIDGEPLRARLKREGYLHTPHALEVARQVLLGLESAHAQGVVHGQLDLDTVWLANGASKSDLDPHGTSVRITNVGLAAFASAQRARAASQPVEASSAGDLVASLALLESLIAEAPAAEVAPQVRSFLAQSRTELPSVAELRETVASLLESTRAPAHAQAESASHRASVSPRAERTPTSNPDGAARATARWPLPTVLALGAVAAALGFAWSRSSNEVSAKSDELVQRRLDLELLQTRVDESETTASAARSELARLTAQLEESQRAAQAALEAERARASSLEASLATVERQRAESEAATRAAQTLAEDAQQRARETEAFHAPTARLARTFDAALDAAQARSWSEAARRLAALELEGASAPSCCRDLAAALGSIERFEIARGAGELDGSQLSEAEAGLERTRASLATFAAQAASWIDHGGSSAARTERIANVVASLSAELAAARVDVLAADRGDWERVTGAAGVQDPAVAFLHAQRFGCEHLSELAARFASELHAWVIVDDALDVPKLQTFHQLRDWLERVHTGAVSLPEKNVRELELAEFAQRWHDLDPGNDQGLEWKRFELPKIGAARREWKNELSLKSRLGDADSGYPIREDGLALYRCTDSDGRVEFWRESALSISAATWRIRRERLGADGLTNVGEGVVRIDRTGSRFDIAGSNLPLLDLRAFGPEVLVAPYPPSFAGELPAALGVAGEHREAMRAAQSTCLVVNGGDVRRWFHPRHGLVREETRTERGWFTRELIYTR